MLRKGEVGVVDVRLVDLPVAVLRELVEHWSDLMRELDLVGAGGRDSAPGRLLELVTELKADCDPFVTELGGQLARALRDGRPVIPEVVCRVPAGAGELARRLSQLLDEADQFCSEGKLLTLVTPEPLARFRRWLLGELVRQARGEASHPWPGAPP